MVSHWEWRKTPSIKDVCDSPVFYSNCWHLMTWTFYFPFGGFLIRWFLATWGVFFFFWPWNWKRFLVFKGMKNRKWMLNSILPGRSDSQGSGSGGLVPGVCRVGEYSHCFRFSDKLGIISSIYKIVSFCKFTLESNGFPGLFFLLLSWIWRQCPCYHLPPQAATPCLPAVPHPRSLFTISVLEIFFQP